jgi:AraC-like DNA-binding protein
VSAGSMSTAQNFSQFRTAVSDSFVPLQVTSDRPQPFFGRIRSATADEVHVTEVSASRHTVERTPELIARGDRKYFKLSLMLAGNGLLVQDNREAVLQPGDLAIYDTNRPYSLVFDDDFRNLVIMFPQHMVDLPVDAIAQLTAVRMSGREEGLTGMIVPFLAQMANNLDHVSGTAGVRLTRSAVDLVTTVLAHQLDLDRGSGNGHRALAQRIRQYIDTNLASVDLGPTQIAAAHFISTRHLHSVFHEQGTTVSSWIRERRLERCRRDLLDVLLADRPVAAIAARWGFVDAAHFSRVFRAAYGISPSELRSRKAS